MAAAIAVFALYKLTHLEFRFGDENVYFYMSDAILGGLLPYRDFFIADPPFFIYMLSIWKFLIGDNLILFKVWPVIFDSLSAALIYLILARKQVFFAALGPALYLFSFTILSTSDYVTGAEVTIFFMLLGIYLDMRERPVWSGVSWALACLCKLYAGPALIGFMLYKVLQREHSSLGRIILGGIGTTFVVLIPFIVTAPKELWHHLITHQFNRPAGLNKWNVFAFFLQMEWLLIFLGTIGACLKSYRTYLLPLLFSTMFFLLYRDLYYLYLHILVPFLVLGAVGLFSTIREKDKDVATAVIAISLCVSIYPIFAYATDIAPDGVFSNPKEVALALESVPEDLPVYGPQEVAPLVALMSGKNLFKNIIDTNTQNFASGTHDLDYVSNEALKSGIYLVTYGEPYLYFDNSLFKKHCLPYMAFQSGIAIYKCYRSNS